MKKSIYFTLFSLALFLTLPSCKHSEPDAGPDICRGMPFSEFNTQNLECHSTLSGDTISLYRTARTDFRQMVITYQCKQEGVFVYCDGQLLQVGDTLDLSYPRHLFVGNSAMTIGYTCVVIAQHGSRIPVVRIQAQTTNIQKAPTTPISIELDANGCIEKYSLLSQTGQIRLRGNSTSTMPKKPYKIILEKKTNVFGLGCHKDWVLLANYADKTGLRTKLAFDMGKALKLPYTPSYIFVEVYLNGLYQGLYQLTDQVEADGDGRPDARFLFEINQRIYEYGLNKDPSYPCFTTSYFPFDIESPSNPTDAQKAEIKAWVKQAESVLFGLNFKDKENGFRKYWDEDTCIKWALINELFKNPDAKGYASIFFYQRVSEGKIYWGPLWDFDLGAGNYGYGNTQNITKGFYITGNKYIARMRADLDFTERMKNTWNQHKDTLWNIIERIPDYSSAIDVPMQKNLNRWPTIKDGADYSNKNLPNTYAGQLEYLKEWLETRYRWLDANW